MKTVDCLCQGGTWKTRRSHIAHSHGRRWLAQPCLALLCLVFCRGVHNLPRSHCCSGCAYNPWALCISCQHKRPCCCCCWLYLDCTMFPPCVTLPARQYSVPQSTGIYCSGQTEVQAVATLSVATACVRLCVLTLLGYGLCVNCVC
jgi:hypothetical protein